jgi:dienelactone hydrolase
VRTLTYGSGTSMRRPEYGDGADLLTRSVDGSAVFGGYDGPSGAFYRWYWGFDFDALPVNGLVWYPEGAGPFPLVLIVHGNHAMSRPSEPGYAYLGEHLASQGYVVAAIDQNFLNGLFFFDGEFAEMPLRAWLILEHLQAWRRWNETPGNPFAGRVDLDRVALIGHSRGGEAVAWAAHLNARAMEPVARVARPGDFGFGIGAVVAIAPSDAYSGPNGRKPDLGDADYLLLAGGHDADTFLLYGVAQYERDPSGADADRVRALAYVHQANHGQFNAVWGDRDRGLYNSLLLNRAPLLDADAQQRAAKALVASFLRASLRDEPAYRAPFRNPPSGSAWLPDGVVATQLRTPGRSCWRTSRTAPGRRTANPRLPASRRCACATVEREQGNRALRLEWDAGDRASFEVAVAPEDAARLVAAPALTFALAAVPGTTPPSELVIELRGGGRGDRAADPGRCGAARRPAARPPGQGALALRPQRLPRRHPAGGGRAADLHGAAFGVRGSGAGPGRGGRGALRLRRGGGRGGLPRRGRADGPLRPRAPWRPARPGRIVEGVRRAGHALQRPARQWRLVCFSVRAGGSGAVVRRLVTERRLPPTRLGHARAALGRLVLPAARVALAYALLGRPTRWPHRPPGGSGS